MSDLRFDGRVAIITGGGGALGRAYALLLGSRGASVVVNDLGVPLSGSGSSRSPAQAVVDQIVAAGGKAVANYDNVLEGDKIVQAAIDAFGRVDIVINNAGILRDVSFLKMTPQQWDDILNVHVNGAYSVTKAAWPHMIKQKYGRVIMTSSAAGLYGNHGQSNYSAAKLALVGFAGSLAKEGLKANVRVNTVAPVAGSRMTETVMPPELVAALKPEFVAPVVAYLCHDQCEQTGAVVETGAGFAARVRWQRNAGVHFPIQSQANAEPSLTPEAIAARWGDINRFDPASCTYPAGLNDTMSVIMSALGAPADSTGIGAGKPKQTSAQQQVKANGANGSESSSSSSSSSDKFESDAVFAAIDAGVKADPSIAAKANCIVLYNLTNAAGAKKQYTLNLKKAAGAQAGVVNGPPPEGKKADLTIDVSDANYVALATNKSSAQALYMKGQLKLKGNLAVAMKLDAVLKAAQAQRSKL